jgi:DeoR/GlpR family transcriptional regulator of sugar metabolism
MFVHDFANSCRICFMAVTDLLLHERQSLLLSRLKTDGRVIAAAIAQELSISEDTVRRDLREMAAAGLCKRVYGGALPATSDVTSLTERLELKPERKDTLARAAVALFEPGMTLFIDAGSTNLAIARALSPAIRLTVITNSPNVASVLIDRQEMDVILLGGKLDHRTGAVIGARAIADAAIFRPDICVLGSCGFAAETGISASDFDEAEFKRSIAQRSRSIVAAITNEKLGAAAPFDVVPVGKNDHIVLEHDAEAGYVRDLGKRGINIILADPLPS